MPLQRFIPSSTDRYISNDKNQGTVKFGHLNAVVDYINTYVAADSLQLEGVGPLTSVPRYITDASGNLSSLAISTGNVGIGTSTPVSKLETKTTDGFGAVRIYNNNDSSSPFHALRGNGGGVGLNTFSSNGTIDSPTDRTGLGYLTRFTGQVYVDGAFRIAARIEYYLTSAPSAANLNCGIRFMTASPTTYSIEERVGITSNGNLQIGDSIVSNRNSKVFIKGSGSTSATTSLLVQNSSGSNAIKITDDAQTFLYGTFGVYQTHHYSDNAGGAYRKSNSYDIIDYLRSYGSEYQLNGGYSGGTIFSVKDGFNTRIKYPLCVSTTFNNPNASAILQADSTTQGFLPPRMSTAQKLAIPTPSAGLMVYDTDLNKSFTYDGTTWQAHW